MIACNDYILLECCIYRILRKHCSTHPAYAQLLDLFHEVRLEGRVGRVVDGWAGLTRDRADSAG
jgi:farnesyl diphosphate synthase